MSKNLQDNLYLFQYPTKTNIGNFDNAAVVNCCVKPINHEVKVDFILQTESRYFDRFKAERFAIAADGKVCYKEGKGQKVTFIMIHRPVRRGEV